MATVAGNTAFQRREVQSEPSGKGRSRLRLVVTRRLGRPSRVHPAHRLAFFAAALVVGVCLVVVAAQAIVASRQIRIDNLRQALATSVAQNENLQVERAALTAPDRILQIAEHKLGMAAPNKVTYLVPLDSSGSVTPKRTSR
jgi:cell division protein FtsL